MYLRFIYLEKKIQIQDLAGDFYSIFENYMNMINDQLTQTN